MSDRAELATAFVDLEDSLFGWDADDTWVRTDGFVQESLGRRARVRTKTDLYPAVPLGPELAGRYARRAWETTVLRRRVNPSAARSSAAS